MGEARNQSVPALRAVFGIAWRVSSTYGLQKGRRVNATLTMCDPGNHRSPHTRFCDQIRRVIGQGISHVDHDGTTLYFEAGYKSHNLVFKKFSPRFGRPTRLKYLWRFIDTQNKKIVYLCHFKQGTKNFLSVPRQLFRG